MACLDRRIPPVDTPGAEFVVILDGSVVATTVEFLQALFLDGLHIQCEVSRNCQKDLNSTLMAEDK